MTDFRALCVELTDCLEKADWPHKQKHVFEQWIYIARKALAEPEPERPTDKELLELMPQQFRNDLATVSCLAVHGSGPGIEPGIFRVTLNTGALEFARAVLDHFGNYPGSPDTSTQDQQID